MIKTGSVFCLILLSLSASAEDSWATVQPSYQQVNFTGFSRARHDMVLSTEVAGKVKQVFVDVGDAIPKNGKVSCLDNTFTKIDINSTVNDIEQAKIDVVYYKKQVNRYQELVKKKNVSINQLDDMLRQLATSERMEQSKRLQKQHLQETLKRHCIKSPAGWLVDERYVEPGQWLDIGSPVAKVGSYSKLLVPFALTVSELNALKAEKVLTVWLPEYKRRIPATIERISPAFDEESRKIQVDLLLERDLPVQRGGLRVDLKLKLADVAGAFLIASKALDKRFEEVWLESKNGQPVRVEFLGNAENGLVRIRSPQLKAGDQFKILQR